MFGISLTEHFDCTFTMMRCSLPFGNDQNGRMGSLLIEKDFYAPKFRRHCHLPHKNLAITKLNRPNSTEEFEQTTNSTKVNEIFCDEKL